MTKLILDTNAFYDFCSVFGLHGFGITCGINQRVDYPKYKAVLEQLLVEKRLFIPATTIFELVSRLREQEDNLKKVIAFLQAISESYSYNLLIYQTNDMYFNFDQYSEIVWEMISRDYMELVKLKDMIVLAKIGSEADILAVFSRIILFLFVVDCCKSIGEQDAVLATVNRVLFSNPFADASFRTVKNNIAHKLHEYYIAGEEGKYKREIFESTFRLSSVILKSYFDFMTECHLADFGPETNKVFASSDSIQTRLFKWYNQDKNLSLLESCVADIRKKLIPMGFNEPQLVYLAHSIEEMFTHGTKREKNDAEDFWVLRYVHGEDFYLISFEMEIIDIIKETNMKNYNFLGDFYQI